MVNYLIEVVDDSVTTRQSLAALLEYAGYSVRTHSSAEELLELGPLSGSACVVSEVVLPGIDGIELLHRLRAKREMSPVVFITGLGNVRLAIAAMKAGAADFLEKPFASQDLLDAIDVAIKTKCRGGPDDDVNGARERLRALTPREIEVLELLVAGNSNKVAAEKLGVSYRTVEFHRSHIIEKTGARSLANLVRLWLAARLVL